MCPFIPKTHTQAWSIPSCIFAIPNHPFTHACNCRPHQQIYSTYKTKQYNIANNS